eukprot:g16529.t1
MAAASSTLYDVAVVGGGVAGLTAAYKVLQQRPDARLLLLEANESRLGGRAFSATTRGNVDLGPAWYWPRDQPLIRSLVRELQLQGVPQRGGFSGEHRIKGGIGAIVEKLRQSVTGTSSTDDGAKKAFAKNSRGFTHPVEVKMGEKLVRLREEGRHVVLETGAATATASPSPAPSPGSSSPGTPTTQATTNVYAARHVIIAIPPQIFTRDVAWEKGAFPYVTKNTRLLSEMKRQPVWMANVGKLVLFYCDRWWNPDAAMMTPMGGMRSYGAFQAYDAGEVRDEVSGETQFALAFFVGGSPSENGEEITTAKMAQKVVQQLKAGAASARGFGVPRPFGGVAADQAEIANYGHAEFKLWATEPSINPECREKGRLSTNGGTSRPSHPHSIRGLNNPDVAGSGTVRRLWFGNSEAADEWAGMLEGAVRAADRAADLVVESLEKEAEFLLSSDGEF